MVIFQINFGKSGLYQSIKSLMNHTVVGRKVQATPGLLNIELYGVAPLVADPPMVTLTLGKIYPFAIHHIMLPKLLNQ